jgi:hypothetical protein
LKDMSGLLLLPATFSSLVSVTVIMGCGVGKEGGDGMTDVGEGTSCEGDGTPLPGEGWEDREGIGEDWPLLGEGVDRYEGIEGEGR